MENTMDLYSVLSNLLGGQVAPNHEFSLTDAEWSSLSEPHKVQIAELVEAAMHDPGLMFPNGMGVDALDMTTITEPSLPTWDALAASR